MAGGEREDRLWDLKPVRAGDCLVLRRGVSYAELFPEVHAEASLPGARVCSVVGSQLEGELLGWWGPAVFAAGRAWPACGPAGTLEWFVATAPQIPRAN